jgi:hypothetical protein
MAYVARLLSAGLEPCAPCRPIPQLALRLTPIPQLAPPTKSNVAPWPTPFPLTSGSILPHPGDDAHQQESSPPTLLCNPPTLGYFVPRPIPTPPTPQHVRPTLGNVAPRHHWPMHLLAQPSRGNVACWPHRLLPALPTSQPMMPQTLTISFPRPNLLPSTLQLLSLPQHVPPPHGCPRTRTNEPAVIHHSSFVEDKGGGLGSFVLVPR